MNCNLTIGHGGFLSMTGRRPQKSSDVELEVRFGVGIITYKINGEARRKIEMGKPQAEFTLGELATHWYSLINLVNLGW